MILLFDSLRKEGTIKDEIADSVTTTTPLSYSRLVAAVPADEKETHDA